MVVQSVFDMYESGDPVIQRAAALIFVNSASTLYAHPMFCDSDVLSGMSKLAHSSADLHTKLHMIRALQSIAVGGRSHSYFYKANIYIHAINTRICIFSYTTHCLSISLSHPLSYMSYYYYYISRSLTHIQNHTHTHTHALHSYA